MAATEDFIDTDKLGAYYKLIEMGYEHSIADKAACLYPKNIEKCIDYITQNECKQIEQETESKQECRECVLPHHNKKRWMEISELLTKSNINNFSELQQLYSKLPIEQYPANKLLCIQSLLVNGDNNKHKITSNLFFKSILPKMIKLVLLSPNIFFKPLYILSTQIKQSVSLTPLQCASIISCSFFGLHDRENPIQCMDNNNNNNIEEATFSDINFTSNNGFAALLNINNKSCQSKLYMILNYFILCKDNDNNNDDERFIIFNRCVLDKKKLIDTDLLNNCDIALNSNIFNVNNIGKIQDIDPNKKSLLIDFANAFIGGGTLSGGNCQEEILFCIYTECIVSCLICEKMKDNESIVIQNCRQWNNDNNYKGYGDNLDINYIENIEEKDINIRYDTIVAIDALLCFTDNFEQIDQYDTDLMLREINKCYIGFSFDINNKYIISTGNVGCGAFGGDLQLKSMLQWIAVLMLKKKRDIEYYSFNHHKAKIMKNVIQYLSTQNNNKYHVKYLWNLLKQYKKNNNDCSLYQYILSN